MIARTLNSSPEIGFYRDADGWHTDRNWNTHPATAEELEVTLIALQALHGLGLQLIHHVATRQLVIADGIEPTDELAVIQTLEQLRALVWPDAVEKEAPTMAPPDMKKPPQWRTAEAGGSTMAAELHEQDARIDAAGNAVISEAANSDAGEVR
jgi:hypothetical protein